VHSPSWGRGYLHATTGSVGADGSPRCPLVQVIQESTSAGNGGERPFYDFLEGCLRHKAEMVIFEAARAIANMNDVSTRELTPAITVLQLFLSSSKPVLRFAAVRTLNKVRPSPASAVMSYPNQTNRVKVGEYQQSAPSAPRCRFVTPAQSLLHDCSQYRGLHVRRVGVVPRSRAVSLSPRAKPESFDSNESLFPSLSLRR
jgi:hypothetical protein